MTDRLYTKGLTPKKVIEEALPHKYSMELNKHDMLILVEALQLFSDVNLDHNGERADDMRSNILTTIGIEEV